MASHSLSIVSDGDRVFGAVASVARLQILRALSAGRNCAGDLAEELGFSPQHVRRHLAVLEKAKLVTVSKVDRDRYYRLVPQHEPAHSKLLCCMLDLLDDSVRA